MSAKSEIAAELSRLMNSFYHIGETVRGGVTRLGYSPEEDEMHRIILEYAREKGFRTWVDCYGNSYVCNFEDEDLEYTMIGSHLDSVIDGGRYDGVAGVLAGLMVMLELKKQGITDIPITTAAFRCEESANFGLSTVGSSLVVGNLPGYQYHIKGRDGRSLNQCLSEFSANPVIDRSKIKRCYELHIEQGKVLESSGINVGAVTAIAAPFRYEIEVMGTADHSGATPMDLRHDALCAASEVILAVEAIAKREAVNHSVGTVGFIENHPNSLNVVPGDVYLKVDFRGIDKESIKRMEKALDRRAHAICERRRLAYIMKTIDKKEPVTMDEGMTDGLAKAAEELGIPCMKLPSGAGHDTMRIAEICPASMIFIPCKDGVSHNPAERTELWQIEEGIRVLCRAIVNGAKEADC